jgi:cupin fold WbuC family metalloprotein
MSASFSFSQINPEAIFHLKSLEFSPTGTRRLCLHSSNDSSLHMMLIEILPDTHFVRHDHGHSDEAVYLIEGSLKYELDYDEVHTLSDSASRSIILLKGTSHSVQSGPNGALYLEVIAGPFTKQIK